MARLETSRVWAWAITIMLGVTLLHNDNEKRKALEKELTALEIDSSEIPGILDTLMGRPVGVFEDGNLAVSMGKFTCTIADAVAELKAKPPVPVAKQPHQMDTEEYLAYKRALRAAARQNK